MKRRLIFISLLAICLFACNSNNKKSIQGEEVYEVQGLLSEVDQLLNKEVLISGHVTHVCKHSGKKCFIENDKGDTSIRIEAKGDITAFDKELIGSTIKVKGKLREHRLSKEYVDNLEKSAQEKLENEEATEEECEAELSNVNDMRKWMKEHDKNHYSIYYVDGLSYEKIDE